MAKSEMREMTEAEARGMVVMLGFAVQFAMVTIAQWAMRSKRPMRDEILDFGVALGQATKAMPTLGHSPETDGHSFDYLAEYYMKRIEDIKQQAASESD
jgi:hypothetical protein